MSIPEVSALFRKERSDRENMLVTGGVSALPDVQILLMEGQEGDLPFITQTTRTPASQLEPFSIYKGEGLIEMQFPDEQDPPSPGAFLLLDLRNRHKEGSGLLECIGVDPNLSDGLPLVILVTSVEQFHGWRGIDAEHCWQLRGRLSPAELARALRSFMHLCATLSEWPAEERPGFHNADKSALINEISKE